MALALVVVIQSIGPRSKLLIVLLSQSSIIVNVIERSQLFKRRRRLRPRVQIHVRVVVPLEVKVVFVELLASQLWKEGLVASIVTIETLLTLFLVVTPLGVDESVDCEEQNAH